MQIRPGDRVRLVSMPSDPNPIAAGETGTVESVTSGSMGQIRVRWDSGRSLALIPGIDIFELIEKPDPRDVHPVSTAVSIPRAVLEGIEAVRVSGKTNMLDLPRVCSLARKLGFDDAAQWLSNPANKRGYAQGIFRGFIPDDQ